MSESSDLSLSSPAFADGDPIPERCGYRNENVNPPLAIDGTPPETESFVLIVDDPDAMESSGKVWEHWVVWNVPVSTGTIPEDWDSSSTEAREGSNDYGEIGYGGPDPPDQEHTYRFGLYALDTTLAVDSGARKNEVNRGMHGHVLAHAQLEGTYVP
ncbi:YbhB/YbcL family Raf kinase inhibitor-like protein [Halobacteriales archaeon QH_8_64_26]|nr:MAG: YbhB/YbcL family Raf kinase inhibitor-like protein [Halobacteriales archaeon QH_8_64_26]